MKYLDMVRENRGKLAAERVALIEEVDGLAENRDAFGDVEAARGEEIISRLEAIKAEDDALAAREAELADAEQRAKNAAKAPTVIRQFDKPEDVNVRNLDRSEARDLALKTLEREGGHLAPFQQDHVDRIIRTRNGDTDGDIVARMALLTTTPAYRSGFMKLVTQATPLLSSEEAAAVNDFKQFRAASHTSAAGGYGVPVLIDPTIVLSSGAADAPILRYCRIETITTDIWKGVSSAAPTWAVVAEGSASTDNMVTLAQPTVTTYTSRSFLPFSVEIDMDYPSFEQEMSSLLSQGYVDYLAIKTMQGSGSDIQGVFTALDAVAGSEVTVTSDGQLLGADFRKVWAALPERWRNRSTWIMHTTAENAARSLSTSGMGSDFTVTMLDGAIPAIFNRPIITTDYAPSFTGTTGAANILVVMDLSNYVLAQRAGMTVELVPHLFDVTANMPTLQRGWLAYARVGGNVINAPAGRLLQNT
jgi:HK97 family phage major capsid protein